MASEIVQDGSVIWTALFQPGRGFARAVLRRRALVVVIFATVLSLAATALILPHLDTEAIAAGRLEPDMTAHQRTEAVDAANRLFRVAAWAQAAVGPLASAFLFAVALYFSFWVAGARAGFKPVFTVAAHALVPAAVKVLLTAPAAIQHGPISPELLPKLLPSSLAAFAPHSWPAPAVAAASAFDLFTLWTFALAFAGMTKATGASRLRAGLVMVVLFLAYVALFKVAPTAAASFGPQGGH